MIELLATLLKGNCSGRLSFEILRATGGDLDSNICAGTRSIVSFLKVSQNTCIGSVGCDG